MKAEETHGDPSVVDADATDEPVVDACAADARADARADDARADFRSIIAEKGHATDNARRAMSRLEAAFMAGALQRTPFIDQALRDLEAALEQEEGQRLGGKSAEASRFILRAIDRALNEG